MLQDTTDGITDLEIAMVGCEFRILDFFFIVKNLTRGLCNSSGELRCEQLPVLN